MSQDANVRALPTATWSNSVPRIGREVPPRSRGRPQAPDMISSSPAALNGDGQHMDHPHTVTSRRTRRRTLGRLRCHRSRAGNAGQYLRVLLTASEYGLSLLTWGREWVRPTPRSERSSATPLEVMEVVLMNSPTWTYPWARAMTRKTTKNA